MEESILLAGDVDAIKEFVFETSSLPQIRGGSDLLLECEEQIRGPLQARHGYKVIYCGGGSFLLQVPPDRAEEVKRDLERLYLEQTLIATVTIVCENPLAVGPTPTAINGWAGRLLKAAQKVTLDGSFAHRMFALSTRMREAKDRKMSAPFYEAFPFGRRCDRCGRRMAAFPDPIEPDKRLCPVCERRTSRGRQRDQEVRGRFNQEFWKRYQTSGYRAQQPEDLDTLVKGAKREYLAFVYADGNNIGSLLHQARSPEQYGRLSKAIEEGTKEALFSAIAEVCGHALQTQEYWPFDIVNVGGDDVTLLIQAGYAWEVAVKFLEQFEKEINARLQSLHDAPPTKVTTSCGIVIADVRYPMRYFEHLARDLLKEAKKCAKREPDTLRSALTFLWLPSPVASEKAEPLIGYYSRPATEGLHRELTARPYDLGQARELLEASQDMARWPRTLRHRWAEALERGVMSSVNLIHYDIARRSDEKRTEMYQTLTRVGKLAASGEGSMDIPAPIWYQAQREGKSFWRTALVDALELAELEGMKPDVEEEAE
ncbi:MAG: Cas10/Cmr2 second palm domain-containing protein [Anaerolineae bacterium]